MKKLLFLFVILVLLAAAGGYWLWAGRQPASPPAPSPAAPAPSAANQDARPLNQVEQAAFLPLVCGGASAGADGFAHGCTSLTSYPASDYGGAGLGLGITLTSVIHGHISNATANEAYVSYKGSFESHATNFGGGILFRADGQGGWVLEKWVPGEAMDGCLSLNPEGQMRMLCLRGATGQGETITVLGTAIPGARDFSKILTASDLRETMDPNANCRLRTSPQQDVLLNIDAIARSGGNYTAAVDYVPASIATSTCAAKNFANAAMSKTTLTLNQDGSAMRVTPALNFAPAS